MKGNQGRVERHFHEFGVLYFFLDELPPGLGFQAEVYGKTGRLAGRKFGGHQEAIDWLAEEKKTWLGDTPCSSTQCYLLSGGGVR